MAIQTSPSRSRPPNPPPPPAGSRTPSPPPEPPRAALGGSPPRSPVLAHAARRQPKSGERRPRIWRRRDPAPARPPAPQITQRRATSPKGGAPPRTDPSPARCPYAPLRSPPQGLFGVKSMPVRECGWLP
ncbi:hypothetical protein PVAP13_7KG115700 [Panicum virgatum]|uniref:Uncharacterized protein n=1 Tax=Panicum virgatum TaxID=38727 RepID=A0A8T0QM78_PANVG|nr:hypothetical protein PVAP13_7KG115700 [Panicum virgatum]